MKLYHLKRTEGVNYDEFDSMIVRAKDETSARAIASDNSGDEGSVWNDPKRATCEALKPSGDAGLVLGSFNAG